VQEPYAVAVLLEKDFIVVDLTQSNYPIFENPYPMDIHESPVTCTAYFADCPPEIIPALYSIGAKHKKQGYSHKEWPVSGGTWTLGAQTYPEIIITGHADGSIKFWDASAITLQMLYKLKTSKAFEKPKAGEVRAVELVEEDPFAVQMVSWCPHSRLFCVVGISAHLILYRFSKYDVTTEIAVSVLFPVRALEVRLQCDIEETISPSEAEPNAGLTDPNLQSPQHPPGSPGCATPEGIRDSIPCLRVKNRPVRMPPGYQAELVVQLLWVDGEPPQQITSLDINSAYGLLALGNCNGLAVVDYIQKTVLLCMSTLELYGSSDPYQRLTRSPRKSRQFAADSKKRIRTSYQSKSGLAEGERGLTELSDNQVSLELERSRSPTSVPYPTSLHNDPRTFSEPMANLKASHYSPVFYLLDNVKGPGRKLSLPTDLKAGHDHVNGHCTSPTSQPYSAGRPRLPCPEGPKLSRRGPSRPPFRKAQSAACMEVSLPASHTEGPLSKPFHSMNVFTQPHIRATASKDRSHSRIMIPPLRCIFSLPLCDRWALPACLSVSLGGWGRAMLQQLHGFSMYSHDEQHTTAYTWNERESRENSFSRSRSSSVSSIDRETKEAVTTLRFMESYARKVDAVSSPCLWVGTSLGVVLVIALSIPMDEEERQEEPVTVMPSGTVLMLKGSVLTFGSLDCSGGLISNPYEVWRDPHAPEDPDCPRRRKLVNFSPSSSQDAAGEGHLVVVCSEKQAKVFLMPAQTRLYVHHITESSFVLRADVVSVCNSVCLACFCANGHVMTLRYHASTPWPSRPWPGNWVVLRSVLPPPPYNRSVLPSLRPLLDVNYLPLTDMRIARTFCFADGGQALYLSSPTEIQRISYTQEMCDSLQVSKCVSGLL
ncbi:hypothetical protein Z043_111371, partial [Scleropages formosus]